MSCCTVRRTLDGQGLEPWGVLGDDVFGAAIMWGEFDPCVHLRGVALGVYDAAGVAVESSAYIEAFFLRERDAREFASGERDITQWFGLANEIRRVSLGGYAYTSDQPRAANFTNSGNGWPFGMDWEDESPPVLVVMWAFSGGQRPAIEFAYDLPGGI